MTEYQWYSIEKEGGRPFMLREEERASIVDAVRQAGERDEFEVEIHLGGEPRRFFQYMLGGEEDKPTEEDDLRRETLLRAAFGKNHVNHALTQRHRPYRLVVRNLLELRPKEMASLLAMIRRAGESSGSEVEIHLGGEPEKFVRRILKEDHFRKKRLLAAAFGPENCARHILTQRDDPYRLVVYNLPKGAEPA